MRVRKQTTDWEPVFAVSTADKGFLAKMYVGPRQRTRKGPATQ